MIVTMMNAAIMIRSFISNRREVSLRWLGASEQVARGRGEGRRTSFKKIENKK